MHKKIVISGEYDVPFWLAESVSAFMRRQPYPAMGWKLLYLLAMTGEIYNQYGAYLDTTNRDELRQQMTQWLQSPAGRSLQRRLGLGPCDTTPLGLPPYNS